MLQNELNMYFNYEPIPFGVVRAETGVEFVNETEAKNGLICLLHTTRDSLTW